IGGLGGGLMGFGGIGGIIVLLLLVFGGGDFLSPSPSQNQTTPPAGNQSNYKYETAEEGELFDFVSVVLADTEDIWSEVLSEYGREYKEPTLVVYTEVVQSACGVASSQTGPFYCPEDQKLYI